MNMSDWYEIENIQEIDTPALVIYPERVKENIVTVKSMVKDLDHLRPHVKTNKSADACALMIKGGIYKFKCATIAEAEMLGTVGAPDVLLAYQPFGPKISRLVNLIKKFAVTRFSCLVDNIASAKSIGDEAVQNGIVIPVYLDLNVGMNRTGIIPGKDAIDLYLACEKINGIRPVGLHVYDGHIRDIDLETREKRCAAAFEPVEQMIYSIEKTSMTKPVLVAGGSPSFPVHAKWGKAECSPGTFIYWDAGYYQNYKEQAFHPAALVVSRVVSLPDETTICTDLGHKSVAAENPLDKRVLLLNAPGLEFKGQSEEHLVLSASKGHTYKVGDVIYGLPYHICPTCALYERAWTINGHRADGEWKITARDRKISV